VSKICLLTGRNRAILNWIHQYIPYSGIFSRWLAIIVAYERSGSSSSMVRSDFRGNHVKLVNHRHKTKPLKIDHVLHLREYFIFFTSSWSRAFPLVQNCRRLQISRPSFFSYERLDSSARSVHSRLLWPSETGHRASSKRKLSY
jgi:hypothetical protein